MQNKENVYEQTTTQTEQGLVINDTVCEEKEVGSADLGKFKDVNALLRAYEALQAEFTRRSQRLKRYEKETENQLPATDLQSEIGGGDSTMADAPEENAAGPDSAKEESVDTTEINESEAVACNKANDANNVATPISRTALQDSVEDKTIAPSLYEQVMANEEVRLKIVGDYLSSIGKCGAPLIKGGTGVLTAPVKKAGSISEAGKMALAYLKSQGSVTSSD